MITPLSPVNLQVGKPNFDYGYAVRRVYFNRLEDWPNIWSIDRGDVGTEINVQDVLLCGVTAVTMTNRSAQYPEPTAWFTVTGWLYVDANNIAHLTATR